MAVFRQVVEARANLPRLVVHLPASAFADTWSDRPTTDAEIGLRLISEAESANARAEAARKAWRLHGSDDDEEGRIECYNGALMVEALARATCLPDDINANFWQMPTMTIPQALTPAGIELLYGHLDTLAGSSTAPRGPT